MGWLYIKINNKKKEILRYIFAAINNTNTLVNTPMIAWSLLVTEYCAGPKNFINIHRKTPQIHFFDIDLCADLARMHACAYMIGSKDIIIQNIHVMYNALWADAVMFISLSLWWHNQGQGTFFLSLYWVFVEAPILIAFLWLVIFRVDELGHYEKNQNSAECLS